MITFILGNLFNCLIQKLVTFIYLFLSRYIQTFITLAKIKCGTIGKLAQMWKITCFCKCLRKKDLPSINPIG